MVKYNVLPLNGGTDEEFSFKTRGFGPQGGEK